MNNDSQLIIYKTDDGSIKIDVRLEDDTVWLTQKQIAIVFGTQIPAINKHIKNIIQSNELDSKATISKMEIVQQEGQRKVKRNIEVYNLDMVISVGYGVNS